MLKIRDKKRWDWEIIKRLRIKRTRIRIVNIKFKKHNKFLTKKRRNNIKIKRIKGINIIL